MPVLSSGPLQHRAGVCLMDNGSGGGCYHCQGPGHLLSSLAKFQVLL